MLEANKALYSSYMANCVFNAFLSYTAIMPVEQCHEPRDKKNFIVAKPFKNIAPESGCFWWFTLVQPLHIASFFMEVEPNAATNTTYKKTLSAYLTLVNLFYYAIFFGVTALCVDRFLAIHLHLRYQEFVSHTCCWRSDFDMGVKWISLVDRVAAPGKQR